MIKKLIIALSIVLFAVAGFSKQGTEFTKISIMCIRGFQYVLAESLYGFYAAEGKRLNGSIAVSIEQITGMDGKPIPCVTENKNLKGL